MTQSQEEVITNTSISCPTGLAWLFREAENDSSNSLRKNYQPKEIYTDYAICFSLSTIDNFPISGSVAWCRPFYNSSVRVGTRYYVHNSFRSKSLRPDRFYANGIRSYIVDQIDQQITECKRQGFDNFFISREDNTGKVNDRIFRGLQHKSKYSWQISNKFYQICPNSANPSCYQRIIYVGQKPKLKEFHEHPVC